ncbi:MAG: DUF1385 domain-containing protein [Anaerolineales bacterium]|nr:DUF1385 domain-containing protein [Anaerolineales bacterium]
MSDSSSNAPVGLYGGQAVIEGVMMRGRQQCAVAVRAPDDQIVLDHLHLPPGGRDRLARLPLVRGLIVLWDSLSLGYRALSFSADVQTGQQQAIDRKTMAGTLVVSLGLALTLFFALPAGAAYGLEIVLATPHWLTALIEGGLRLLLLVGYIAAIGTVPEIRRVYAYHGAEHKTINAFEANDPDMTPQSVARFPRQHARCGTAFLLTVVVFSILLFALLGPMPIGLRLLSRILMIPVLAAISYEYIRWTGRHQATWWAQVLLLPNLGLQALTTREPEAPMIEVALAAFRALRASEGKPATPEG